MHLGSSRFRVPSGVDIVDFKHKIVHISVAVSFSFNDLNAVINSLHFSCRDREVEVVEYTSSMSFQLPGETSKQRYSGAQSLVDPVVEESLGLPSIR